MCFIFDTCRKPLVSPTGNIIYWFEPDLGKSARCCELNPSPLRTVTPKKKSLSLCPLAKYMNDDSKQSLCCCRSKDLFLYIAPEHHFTSAFILVARGQA